MSAGAILVTAGAILSGGCWDHLTCTDLDTCPLGAGSGGSSTSSTSGTGGEDSGPPPSCIPSQSTTPVVDACGVFASTMGSDTNGKGTQAAPYRTLVTALSKAGSTPVYACAGTTPFSETLTFAAGATIYGGLDCASWSYIGATSLTTITAGPGEVPVTLAMGADTKLVDLHVLAADASDDDRWDLVHRGCGQRCHGRAGWVRARGTGCGDRAAGQSYANAAMGGTIGNNGTDACMGPMVFGGASVSSGCGTPDSTSGAGGIGQVVSGGNGSTVCPAPR